MTAAPVLAAANARAGAFRARHRPGAPVVLPNAWDAGSARTVEAAGFPAVATSSAAIAETLGYSDGETMPVDEMLDAVARIVRAVAVPVTVDLERGYGLPPDQLVERIAATGAVGCNLEDSDPRTGELVAVDAQVGFLAAVRSAARSAGVDLVVNARIDAYLVEGLPDPLAAAVGRARRYLAAGADCVYPILADPADVRTLVAAAGGPVNVLATVDGPPPPALAALGVARISYAADLHRAGRAHLAALLARIAGA
jgi:2-methylisocitrate lyase-like PEP mutase family enzyme